MDATSVVEAAQLVATYKAPMLASLHSTKRRLTAQFNEGKKKEDEEKTMLVESIAELYNDLAELNHSIDAQKKERAALAETNKRRERLAYGKSFTTVVDSIKHAHQLQCEDRRKILEAISIDLEEKKTVLRSKQSAQLASLNPPRELTRQILSQTHTIERLVAEADTFCTILRDVIDVEKVAFDKNIVEAEVSDRNLIFAREEARLIAEKKEAEQALKDMRTRMANEKSGKEVSLAQLILQQRLLQGDSEMYLHEIRELERAYDQHEKAVAERRYKKTAAYKFQVVQDAFTTGINTGIIKPLKSVANVALATTEAIIPKHEHPPSPEEIERKSEERRQIRDKCTAYLAGLKFGIAEVDSDCHWMEEQNEMVKALLYNDDLSLNQLSARIREILLRKKPTNEDDEEGEEGGEYSGTLGRTITSTGRRSVSSTQFSSF